MKNFMYATNRNDLRSEALKLIESVDWYEQTFYAGVKRDYDTIENLTEDQALVLDMIIYLRDNISINLVDIVESSDQNILMTKFIANLLCLADGDFAYHEPWGFSALNITDIITSIFCFEIDAVDDRWRDVMSAMYRENHLSPSDYIFLLESVV